MIRLCCSIFLKRLDCCLQGERHNKSSDFQWIQFVWAVSSETLNLLYPNLVWWHIIMSQGVNCYAKRLVCYLLTQSHTWGLKYYNWGITFSHVYQTVDPSNLQAVPLLEFMYFVFTHMWDVPCVIIYTCMPGERFCKWFKSLLLCLFDVVWVLLTSFAFQLILCKQSRPHSVSNCIKT